MFTSAKCKKTLMRTMIWFDYGLKAFYHKLPKKLDTFENEL
jgi:hypothetical protein